METGTVELRVRGVSMVVMVPPTSAGHSPSGDGRTVASGIYLYQLTAGTFREVKKLVLMR